MPWPSSCELRSATSVTASTRGERISKLRVRRKELTRPFRDTVSVEIGWTLSSPPVTPAPVRKERILDVQPANSRAAASADPCSLVTERFQTM